MTIESALDSASADGCTLTLRQTPDRWEVTATRPLPADREVVPESPKRYINAIGFSSSKDLATAIYTAVDLCLHDYEVHTWTLQPFANRPAVDLLDLLKLKEESKLPVITRRL